jgi:hypothetical protein
MSDKLSLLCVHGVGRAETDPEFRSSWTGVITEAMQRCNPEFKVSIDFLEYDALFDKDPPSLMTYGAALMKLLGSSALHGIGDVVSRSRGVEDIPEIMKWTAGMVAQWSTDGRLREQLRQLVLDSIRANTYDAVLAHSLGSLICYDTFIRNASAIKDKVFVSFGSQIGNPAVRDVFAGRIQPLDARKWYHLFNPCDNVLTRPLEIAQSSFEQVTAAFDIPNDILNHSAVRYLSHANTMATVWRELAGAPGPRAIVAADRGVAEVAKPPDRRALLIGINDYPDPTNRLEGCVNDVFLMSSVLQECGFLPDEIRVVLNERATTQGIMERLHWLLDGVREGDERVLYYSGHGAQIPRYNVKEEPDHVDECLVPYDFDWSPARAILDNQFCELYSQLPYGSYFVAMFDCCHSGGITRDGGPRVRGLTPPDDIRHRGLEWDRNEQMWVPRKFPGLNDSIAKSKGADYVGRNGATRRLGRAMTLRTQSEKDTRRLQTLLGHRGPYMPVLLEACQENEFSYEYRDGATSYGAYTYCMAKALRENPRITFRALNELVTAKLHRLKYKQTPSLVGHTALLVQPVPWGDAGRSVSDARKRAAGDKSRTRLPRRRSTQRAKTTARKRAR